jgi:hypothetical protein
VFFVIIQGRSGVFFFVTSAEPLHVEATSCFFSLTTNIEMASSEGFLRQRKATDTPDPTIGDSSENEPRKEEVVWGKTPGGHGARTCGHPFCVIHCIV